MDPTRAQLEAEFAKLNALIPGLKADYPDEADFWPAFACLADAIGERIGEEDSAWWRDQLEQLLASHGLASGWPPDA